MKLAWLRQRFSRKTMIIAIVVACVATLAVTLVALNLTLGRALGDLAVVPRTFVVATVAVPIVIYVLMPRLHRLRARLLTGSLMGH